jgi:hypothetical protein
MAIEEGREDTNYFLVRERVLTFDTSARNCATNTIGSAGVAAELKRIGWTAEHPEGSAEGRRERGASGGRTHHDLGGVDRLILALICRDLEGAGDGFDSRKDVRDGRFQVDTTGRDQPDGMLEVRLGADVRKQVTETALTQEIDVQLQRAAEP